MLHVHPENGGTLRRYTGDEIARNVYGKEFQLNVQHNTATHMVDVFINGAKKLSAKDNGDPKEGFYYFKTGVYAQEGASPVMTSKVRNISLWKK